jgi:hypothetical protein
MSCRPPAPFEEPFRVWERDRSTNFKDVTAQTAWQAAIAANLKGIDGAVLPFSALSFVTMVDGRFPGWIDD